MTQSPSPSLKHGPPRFLDSTAYFIQFVLPHSLYLLVSSPVLAKSFSAADYKLPVQSLYVEFEGEFTKRTNSVQIELPRETLLAIRQCSVWLHPRIV